MKFFKKKETNYEKIIDSNIEILESIRFDIFKDLQKDIDRYYKDNNDVQFFNHAEYSTKRMNEITYQIELLRSIKKQTRA